MTDLNQFSVYEPSEFGPQLPYYPIPYLHTLIDNEEYLVYQNEFGNWVKDKKENKIFKTTDKAWNKILMSLSLSKELNNETKSI